MLPVVLQPRDDNHVIEATRLNLSEREVIPLPCNINNLDWQTLALAIIDAKSVFREVANLSSRSTGTGLAGKSPKAKVTRSNRVGCASFLHSLTSLSAECPRNRFSRRSHRRQVSARSGPPAFFVWFILEVAPDVRTPADALRDFQRPRLAKAV